MFLLCLILSNLFVILFFSPKFTVASFYQTTIFEIYVMGLHTSLDARHYNKIYNLFLLIEFIVDNYRLTIFDR